MHTDEIDVWSDPEANVGYGQPPVLPIEEDAKQNDQCC